MELSRTAQFTEAYVCFRGCTGGVLSSFLVSCVVQRSRVFADISVECWPYQDASTKVNYKSFSLLLGFPPFC
jgi:hypothetical protein